MFDNVTPDLLAQAVLNLLQDGPERFYGELSNGANLDPDLFVDGSGTFADLGVGSTRPGFFLRFTDGTEFQVSVVQTQGADQ